MVVQEEGVVISVEGECAQVRMMRHGDCKSCGACPGDDSTVTRIKNTLGAEPGQRVAIEMKNSGMLRAAFIVYILPLIAVAVGIIGGAFIAGKSHLPVVPWEIGDAVFFLVLSLLFIKHYDGKVSVNTEELPETVRILA